MRCCLNHHVILRPDQLDHLLKLINKMEYYLNADCTAYGKSIYTKTLLAEILVFINFLYHAPTVSPALDNRAFDKLQPVLSYIQDHLSEKLTLDVLAKQMYISKYHLSHRFKEAMGYPLSEYITKKRLAQAKVLLRQGCSVALAGERSGFRCNAHFIRTFTKRVGVSPKQYAKQYLSLEEYDSPVTIHRDVFTVDQQPPEYSRGNERERGV